MKKTFMALALIGLGVFVKAGEVMDLGKAKLDLGAGTQTLMIGSLKAGLNFSWKTDKWYNFQSAGSEIKKVGDNAWQFTASTVPFKGTEKTSFTQLVKKTAPDAVEFEWSYDPSHLAAIGQVFMVNFPMNVFDGKEVLVNGKKMTVQNITKFGWFSRKAEEQSLEVTAPDGTKLLFECDQKCAMTLSSFQNSVFQVRFQAIGGGKLNLKLTVK